MFNGLTDAEIERLSVLAEELGEASQRVGKILRHGYESVHPNEPSLTNRKELEKELGDIANIISFMVYLGELSFEAMADREKYKATQFQGYLHHQDQEHLDNYVKETYGN